MKLDATFSELDRVGDMPVTFSEAGDDFSAQFGELHTVTEYVGGEPYDGQYAVTPKVEAQILPTKGKVMLDDVTVLEIPFFETSNTSGGNTVYIAKEI